MKKAITIATLAVVTTFSLVAAAGQWTSSWGTITKLESYGDDTHIAGLDLSDNPGNCSDITWGKVDYTASPEKKEGLARILTAAFLAGRQVKVKMYNTCQNGSPKIYGVQVQ